MEREIIAESRVLIVDDQEANVLLLERILQQAGYRNYLSLTDSRQMLDQFRIFQPDLILLDLMMPKLDGYAILKQLAGWLPSGVYLPILVITADISRVARQKALSLGAKDFLTKPIDAPEAMLRIYNLLLTRWLHREMEQRNQFFVARSRQLKNHLLEAMAELERLVDGRPSAQEFAGLRSGLQRTLEATAELAGEAGPQTAAAGQAV